MTSDPQITDNEARHRYEISVDGELAGYAEYQVLTGARLLPHTEIREAYEGQGLGSRLIRFALDDIRARGLHVVPMCPFVAAFLREHREDVDLVQPGQRAVFGL